MNFKSIWSTLEESSEFLIGDHAYLAADKLSGCSWVDENSG